MKMSIAPRFKVKMIKEIQRKVNGATVILPVGMVLYDCSLHNKPIDGLRWYQDKNNYILVPLDCFTILEKN